ncbi:ACP S-malonyltransferase, partial [Leuconostoc gelidum subsp. gasicomitatum]
MEKEIALERIQLLEDNGIYLKRNISGKKAVIFPGHGSQYVNMLSDLKGKHKIVDEVLKESEDYYKEIAGMPFWERLKTDEINTIPTLMQPAIIIANEVYFRILKKKYGVCPNVLLGHSLGEISALCAASVISFKDAIKIAYQRAKCLEFLDEKSKGRMISLKLSSNEEEKAINNYLFLHDNLELAIVNSQTQKIISGTKEDIKQLEKYCESIEIVSYILPVPYPFHSALLESIKGKYQQEIKKISFTIPSINIYSTILSRLYLKKDFVNIVEILGNQLIEPFNFKSIIEDLYNNYNVKKFFECGSNRIMTNIVDEILKGKEYTCINLNSKKENDFVTLKKAEVKLSMIDNQDSNHSLYAIINSVTGYPIDIIKKSIETNDFQSNYGLQLALSSETQEQIIEKYNRKSQSQYTSFDALILNKVPEYENSSSKKNDELLIKLGNAEQISDKVKGYISEKTGYPL